METADTTEKMADTQPPSVTDADPNGDILLVVGPSDSAASLRISSKVLSLASPVFVVLFSRKFDGGRSAMATPTSSEPHRIALPEDDPEAMVVVCHALHFRPTRTDNGSLCLLEKVAVICDKYDLATALSGWSERALQCWKADTDGDAIQCMKLLCIAFVLGSHDAFWVVSWKLLYRCSKNYRFLYEESYPHPITLPEGLIRSMLVHTDTTLISLQKAAENCITEWMRDDPDDKWDRTLAHYIKDFRLMELWPLSQIRECTVENVIRQFHQGQECTREGDGCYCHHMGYGFVGKLQRAADDICMQRGLCLSCVKQGRFLPEDGNCTAFIASECSSPEAKNSLPFFKHTN